jgi:DNA-binding LacI/PurR family transcriptional regulator
MPPLKPIRRRPTLKDVGASAGVSPMTVSLVLRGSPQRSNRLMMEVRLYLED